MEVWGESAQIDSPHVVLGTDGGNDTVASADKVEVVRRKKLPGIDVLRARMDEQLSELRDRRITVTDPPDDSTNKAGDKGSREKRTLRGNTKSTKKHMKEAHRQRLAQLIAHYDGLLTEAQHEEKNVRRKGNVRRKCTVHH
mmetsp:Transcript_18020/g.32669  ORF Transcript_18020/g.32669 Transcript_18020/m.32669 type:complete len:141 (-) Transcript_18020:261-683(-)